MKEQNDNQQGLPGETAAADGTDGQRRKALIRLGRSVAYAAPATLIALTLQAHATSANG